MVDLERDNAVLALQLKREDLQSKIENLKDSDSLFGHLNYLRDQHNIRALETLQAYQRFMHEALEQIDGYKIIEDNKLIEKLLEFTDDSNCIISIGTKHQGNWLDKSKLIHSCHAYSIKGVDKATKTIDVVNPWNTAQYITLSFDEFEKYFSTINVAQID